MRGLGRVACALAALLCPLTLCPALFAQAIEISADDKARAAALFRQAESAFKRRQYAQAAEAFEQANGIAPHPAAVFNAARAWERAGELSRAANLCARFLADAPEGDARRAKANALLSELIPKLGRIEVVERGASAVEIDGVPRELEVTYVDPGDHTVQGVFGERVVRRKLSVVAGSVVRVTLERPKPEPAVAPATADEIDPEPVGTPPDHDERPLTPTWVWVGAGATAVLGGLTVWSGLDTQAARREYDEQPTPEGLDEGRAKQRRTNLLLGATLVTGAATGAIALLLTEWSPEPREPSGDVALSVGVASLAVRGRF